MKPQSPENSGETISQQSCAEPERSEAQRSQSDPPPTAGLLTTPWRGS
jgi:hypothetical protein